MTLHEQKSANIHYSKSGQDDDKIGIIEMEMKVKGSKKISECDGCLFEYSIQDIDHFK